MAVTAGEDTSPNGKRQLLEEIPAGLERALLDLLPGSTKPEIAVRADITQGGTYGESWFVIAGGRMLVFEARRGFGSPLVDVPLADIKSVRVRLFYGNGTLEVTTDSRTFDAVRFSRSVAGTFESVAEILNRSLTSGSSVLEIKDLPENGKSFPESKCPKCGRTLPIGSDTCPFCIQKRQIFLRLLTYVKPYWFIAVSTFVLSLVVTGLSLVDPILQKVLVDDAIGKGNVGILKWIVVAYLGVHALNSFVGAVRGYYMSYLGQKVTYDLSTEVYKHLQKLSMNFYDKRQTGSIMTRVTGDVARLQGFIVSGVQDILIQLLTVIFIGVTLFSMNWRLAALALLPTPVVAFGTVWFAKKIHKVYHRVWRRSAEVNAILGDTLPGIRIVKAFGREQDEIDRFSRKQRELLSSHMEAVRLSTSFYPSMGFVMILGAAFIWGYGGYRVINEAQAVASGSLAAANLTLGDLLAFIGYMWRLYGPVQQLSRLSDMLQQAATSAERVFEVLDTQPDIKDAPKAVDLEIRGDIEFKGVSFAYEKGEPVLKDITLSIGAGEMIGVVGASGAGKTTLINLLSRFYDVSEGAITIDGVDIRNISLKALRDQLSIVLQEPFLFHASIAENIAYGRPDATREEIIWAAKMANAHDFIMEFPDGYDTRLGERGVGLSGGQKQRISIARAILKNPKILILDEATSAVDTETERLIQEAINRLVKGRTTIAIAHRLSTLKNADRIIVLEEGRLVEMGTHEELLSKEDGVFARLVRMQAEVAKANVV